jgi:hypothetical protein
MKWPLLLTWPALCPPLLKLWLPLPPRASAVLAAMAAKTRLAPTVATAPRIHGFRMCGLPLGFMLASSSLVA